MMGIVDSLVPTNTLIVSTGACIVGGLIGGLLVKKVICTKADIDSSPEKWVKVGELKELRIYPVKGLPGILVNEAILANLGLKGLAGGPLLRDRVFAIINAEGKAISLGNFPVLALARVQVEGNRLHLYHVNDPSLDIVIDIPTTAKDAPPMKYAALYHGERIKGVDCGDEVAEWLTKLTGVQDLRLLYHLDEETERGLAKRNTRFHTYRASHTGRFQDETSYMLMTDESVAAVNAHLEKPVSHTNFRPTIVLSGVPEPFAEDFWGYIKIGQQDNAPIMKTSLPCHAK